MKFARRCRDASKNAQAKQRSKINISDAKLVDDPHPNSKASNWLLLDRYVGISQRSGIYWSKLGDTLESGSQLMQPYVHVRNAGLHEVS